MSTGTFFRELLQVVWHEIFSFKFFHESVFQMAPDYTNKEISNFYENSRRYS